MQLRQILPLIFIILAVSLAAQPSTSPGQLSRHVYFLASDSLLGRGFGTPQGLQAARYIAGQFREAGIEPLGGSYLHPFNHRMGILNIPGNNVAGIIPGNDPDLKDEYIVLGAHYDHLGWKVDKGDTVVYNGADDNASGTASIIEIGRNLSAIRSSLGRSVILVAFDGEESGLVGSRVFLRDSIVPPHRIRLMFSLDMVGMVKANKGLDLIGIKRLNDYKYLITELSNEHGLVIAKARRRLVQGTDTAPFGALGIPSVHAFTGLTPTYHKPEDEPRTLDYEGMASVASYMSDAARFLSSTDRISDMQGPREGEPVSEAQKIIRPGLRLNVGSSAHDYREQFYKGKQIFAAGAGLFVNIRAAGFLNIQPELLYETKGSHHADGVFRTHAVTAPLNFQIISPENSYLRTFFQLGGYYTYYISGKIGNSSIDFENQYDHREAGFTFGAGFEMMNIQVGIVLQNSFTDLERAQGDAIRNEAVFFMLGTIF